MENFFAQSPGLVLVCHLKPLLACIRDGMDLIWKPTAKVRAANKRRTRMIIIMMQLCTTVGTTADYVLFTPSTLEQMIFPQQFA